MDSWFLVVMNAVQLAVLVTAFVVVVKVMLREVPDNQRAALRF